MQKLPLVIFSALALCSVGFAQDQPKIVFPPDTLVVDETPTIEKRGDAEITISTDKSEYEGTDLIRLDITLTNTGDKSFTMNEQNEVEEFFVVEVIGPNGKPLPKRQLNAMSRLGKLIRGGGFWDLKPGKSQKASIWLTSFFDMSLVGSYKVTAGAIFHLGTTGKQYVSIKSEPVTIKVKSYPPISEWR